MAGGKEMGIFFYFSGGGMGGAGGENRQRQSSGLHYTPHKPRRKKTNTRASRPSTSLDTIPSPRPPPSSSTKRITQQTMARLTILLIAIVAAAANAFVSPNARCGEFSIICFSHSGLYILWRAIMPIN